MAEDNKENYTKQVAIKHHFERATSTDLSDEDKNESAHAFFSVVKASNKKPEEVLQDLMFKKKKP
jgi:hypothetical protein